MLYGSLHHFTYINDWCEVAQVTLPERFAEGFVLSFAPCSNLCLYMLGAAACLQRASNFQSVKPGAVSGGCSLPRRVLLNCWIYIDV